MPLNLANLVSNRASAEIDFGNGNILNVEYLPAGVTDELLAGLSGMSNPGALSDDTVLTKISSVTKTLLALLASWDLVDDAGETLPIDAEHLSALGLVNEWTLLNGILSAQGQPSKS